MTTVTALGNSWRYITSGTLVLAAALALIAGTSGEPRNFPLAWPVLAVALAVAAFGHPREGFLIGRLSLMLFALGFAIQALTYLVFALPGIPPLGLAPILAIAITNYAVFGLAVILGVAHVIGMVSRRTDRAERPVSLVPTVLGVTALAGLMALFLQSTEWLVFIFPLACMASAIYLLPIGPKAA